MKNESEKVFDKVKFLEKENVSLLIVRLRLLMTKTPWHKILKTIYNECQKATLKQWANLLGFFVLFINWSTLEEIDQIRVYL